MAQTHSPLRYPGGKSCMLALVTTILDQNRIRLPHYAEPYAGGASLALALLFGGRVSDIHLNDIDVGIWSFWHSVLNNSKDLINLIEECEITVDNWHHQKAIYRKGYANNALDLGFATFFLNRTNRSGIIGSGGVIGGLSQQGNYKIDCRFNKSELIRRISRIAKYKSQIHLTNLDAIDFMNAGSNQLPRRAFFVIDPPYFAKGSSLYTSFYSPEDHNLVSKTILSLNRPWILTYDNVPDIALLYHKNPSYIFDIKYSAQTKRLGTELLITSKGLTMPDAMMQIEVYPKVSLVA